MDFTILISNSSELPIYMQIVEQIREQIVLEKIPSNTPLPSIRQLSKDLDISVITQRTRCCRQAEMMWICS